MLTMIWVLRNIEWISLLRIVTYQDELLAQSITRSFKSMALECGNILSVKKHWLNCLATERYMQAQAAYWFRHEILEIGGIQCWQYFASYGKLRKLHYYCVLIASPSRPLEIDGIRWQWFERQETLCELHGHRMLHASLGRSLDLSRETSIRWHSMLTII